MIKYGLSAFQYPFRREDKGQERRNGRKKGNKKKRLNMEDMKQLPKRCSVPQYTFII